MIACLLNWIAETKKGGYLNTSHLAVERGVQEGGIWEA